MGLCMSCATAETPVAQLDAGLGSGPPAVHHNSAAAVPATPPRQQPLAAEPLQPGPEPATPPPPEPAVAALDRAELLRTPAGPLESSPESSPQASPGGKRLPPLAGKAGCGPQEGGDFDIPALHTGGRKAGFARDVVTQLEDRPLSNFRAAGRV